MKRALERYVRDRAQNQCEYCRLPQWCDVRRKNVEHVIAKQHGGTDEESNLALACFRCNLRKGPNLSGLDPDSGELSRLFIGRTTIAVLGINDPAMVLVRRQLILAGVFPSGEA